MNILKEEHTAKSQAQCALETFVTDNADLDRLEAMLSQFNIFEAVGAVRHEVRHSDFLAYLLSPRKTTDWGMRSLNVCAEKRWLLWTRPRCR